MKKIKFINLLIKGVKIIYEILFGLIIGPFFLLALFTNGMSLPWKYYCCPNCGDKIVRKNSMKRFFSGISHEFNCECGMGLLLVEQYPSGGFFEGDPFKFKVVDKAPLKNHGIFMCNRKKCKCISSEIISEKESKGVKFI